MHMHKVMILVLAAALLAQPARADGQRQAAPENTKTDVPAFVTAVPLQYGEHPSQSFGINYYPDGPARPLLIYIHSGGWASGPITQVPPIPPLYQKLGLAFAVIGHRTVKEFRDPAQVTDVQNAVRHIKENAAKWNIDPDRIAVTGRSSGGHLTMWVGFHPDSPDVACILPRSAPATLDPEFIKTFSSTLSLDNYYRMMFGDVLDDPEEMARIYKYLSPGTYMSPDDPPTLFLHNYTSPPGPDAKDNWAAHHHAFGVDAYKRLKAVGGTAELFINRKGKGGSDAAEEAFLRKYLLGEKGVKMPPSGLEEIEAEADSGKPPTSDVPIQ
jgi:acetyl esterase/lipase